MYIIFLLVSRYFIGGWGLAFKGRDRESLDKTTEFSVAHSMRWGLGSQPHTE